MMEGRPLKVGDKIVYPISVFDMIFDPETRKTLTEVFAQVNERIDHVNITPELKEKLVGLFNYDDTALQQRIAQLENWKNQMVGASADNVINTFKEIEDFLSTVTGADSLGKMLSDLRSAILAEISGRNYLDADGIRQIITPYVTRDILSVVAFSGNYNDLSNKPVVDSSLNSSSDNAISNKAVKQVVDTLLPKSAGVTTGAESQRDYADITSFVLNL